MEKEETGDPSNAMWGNTSWGMTPWMQQKQGASGMDVAALVLGIAGTAFGLASGGLGLFNRNGQNGQNGNGGPNVMDRLAAVEAQVAVSTASDVAAKELTAALIENAKKDAEIKILQSERLLGNQIVAVNNQVLTNTGVLGCVEGKVNDLIKIGIPQANIIPTPTMTASTAG